MLLKKLSLAAAIQISAVAVVGAQGGLLSIGSPGDADFDTRLPFAATVAVDFGWDSNPGSRPSDTEEDSAYMRGGVNVAYAGGSRVTHIDLNAGFSTLYYFDKVSEQEDDVLYGAKIGTNVRHRVNRRLTLGNNLYFAYEVEPDYVIGASASRRLDQYIYGYNSAWASYAWSRRFSTVSRYTISGIQYENDGFAASEDRITQTLSQELRYVYNRLTTLVGEARFTMTEYDTAIHDHNAIHLLAGVDHAFSERTLGTIRVGAEYRDYDDGRENWSPFFESSLTYRLAKHTNLALYNRIGYEDSELAGDTFNERYTYRSALSLNHQFSERVRGNANLTYVHNDFESTTFDIQEDLLSINFGVGVRVLRNIDWNANMSYTILESDEALREFDRWRLSSGLSITF